MSLHRFLYRLSRNPADADDLLQEAFLTVWRKRDQYSGRGSLDGFLRRTAYRVYLNHRERRRRRAALALRAPKPAVETPADDSVERHDTVNFLFARIREGLDALPEEAREAFVLFRFEGLSCREISQLTQVPAKTVSTRVRRATLLLAARLRKYQNEMPIQ